MSTHEPARGMDRREAIKKSIGGAAAAGLVWSAPRIEGLTLRPNYAQAMSGKGVGGVDLTVRIDTASPNRLFSQMSSCGIGRLRTRFSFSSQGPSLIAVANAVMSPATAGTIQRAFIFVGSSSASPFANLIASSEPCGPSFATSEEVNNTGGVFLRINYDCA